MKTAIETRLNRINKEGVKIDSEDEEVEENSNSNKEDVDLLKKRNGYSLKEWCLYLCFSSTFCKI